MPAGDPRPLPGVHSARITAIASRSASTDSRADRRGPPIAAIASQKAPAPMPSSTRPPDRMSRLATARASTAGGRSGRFTTFGNTPIRSVAVAIAVSSVHVSRNAGW